MIKWMCQAHPFQTEGEAFCAHLSKKPQFRGNPGLGTACFAIVSAPLDDRLDWKYFPHEFKSCRPNFVRKRLHFLQVLKIFNLPDLIRNNSVILTQFWVGVKKDDFPQSQKLYLCQTCLFHCHSKLWVQTEVDQRLWCSWRSKFYFLVILMID